MCHHCRRMSWWKWSDLFNGRNCAVCQEWHCHAETEVSCGSYLNLNTCDILQNMWHAVTGQKWNRIGPMHWPDSAPLLAHYGMLQGCHIYHMLLAGAALMCWSGRRWHTPSHQSIIQHHRGLWYVLMIPARIATCHDATENGNIFISYSLAVDIERVIDRRKKLSRRCLSTHVSDNFLIFQHI